METVTSSTPRVTNKGVPKGIGLGKISGSILAGGIAAGVSYSYLVPFLMVQTNASLFNSPSEGFSQIRRQSGLRGTLRGFTPAYFGFVLQGAARFGLYESYKRSMLTSHPERGSRYKVWLVSSGLAEFIATAIQVPYDVARQRMQILDPSTLKPVEKGSFNVLFFKIYAEGGLTALFKSAPLMWAIHVPFTMIQFATYERLMEFAEGHWMNKSDSMSRFPQVIEASFVSGFVGGSLGGLAVSPLVNALLPAFKRGPLRPAMVAGAAGTIAQASKGLMADYFRFAPGRILLLGLVGGVQWSLFQGIRVYLTGHQP